MWARNDDKFMMRENLCCVFESIIQTKINPWMNNQGFYKINEGIIIMNMLQLPLEVIYIKLFAFVW